MKVWPYELGSYSPSQVQEYCVRDAEWQKVRLSMKGVNTPGKLVILDNWRTRCIAANGGTLSERARIQIDNYLNALKRGGQLDMDLKVRK